MAWLVQQLDDENMVEAAYLIDSETDAQRLMLALFLQLYLEHNSDFWSNALNKLATKVFSYLQDPNAALSDFEELNKELTSFTTNGELEFSFGYLDAGGDDIDVEQTVTGVVEEMLARQEHGHEQE